MNKKRTKQKIGELKQRVWDLKKELRIANNQVHYQKTEEISLQLRILHLTERLHESSPEAKAIELRKSLAHMDPEEAQKRFDWIMGNDKAQDEPSDALLDERHRGEPC